MSCQDLVREHDWFYQLNWIQNNAEKTVNLEEQKKSRKSQNKDQSAAGSVVFTACWICSDWMYKLLMQPTMPNLLPSKLLLCHVYTLLLNVVILILRYFFQILWNKKKKTSWHYTISTRIALISYYNNDQQFNRQGFLKEFSLIIWHIGFVTTSIN